MTVSSLAIYTACLVTMVVPYIGPIIQVVVVLVGCAIGGSLDLTLRVVLSALSLSICGLAVTLAHDHASDPLPTQSIDVSTPESIALVVLWCVQFAVLLGCLLSSSAGQ